MAIDVRDTLTNCLAVACAALLMRLLGFGQPPPADVVTLDPVDFAGAQVAILCGQNGRYLEVDSDGWLYASAFTHNKHAARFDVEPVGSELLRSLASTRVQRTARRSWPPRDMRLATASTWDDGASSSPMAARRMWGLTGLLWRGRRARSPSPRRRHRGWRPRVGRAALPVWGRLWEVLGRGEDGEYVVRIGAEGRLSYRSPLLISEDAIWSHAVDGFISWREPTSGEPTPRACSRQHGALGAALRALSARFRAFRAPPVIDTLEA